MGVLSVQLVVPFMDLVTPVGTTPPYALTLPKAMVELEVPLPPSEIPLGSELKVNVREAALTGCPNSNVSVTTLVIIQNALSLFCDDDERTIARECSPL